MKAFSIHRAGAFNASVNILIFLSKIKSHSLNDLTSNEKITWLIEFTYTEMQDYASDFTHYMEVIEVKKWINANDNGIIILRCKLAWYNSL